MNTTHLKTFLALARLQNFSRTAKELYVAQSTITNRIAELEKELGHPLFFRTTKSMKLTEAGEKFLDYANRILDLERNAIHSLNHTPQYDQHLHLGTTNTIYECYLKAPCFAFLKEHPATSTKLTIGHSTELLHMLESDVIDCIFSYVPLFGSTFQCHCFASDELVLVCRFESLDYKKGIYKKDLQKLPYLYCNFLLQDAGIFIRQLFPEHYQFPFEIDNSIKLTDYVCQGLGYTFLPRSLVSPLLASKKLRIIPLLDFDSPQIYSYYIHKKKNPACSVFLPYLPVH